MVGKTDFQGQIELGPEGELVETRRDCPWYQIKVTDVFCQLAAQLGPRTAMQLPVATRLYGIRVPAVVWMPEDKWPELEPTEPLPFVPDLCVEVLTDEAYANDVDRKADAYLHSGAQEVIVVGPRGGVEFRGLEGRRPASIFRITLEPEPQFFSRA
jgi:Uma2 family endonuclease